VMANETKPPKPEIIQNLTAKRLTILGDQGAVLILPPFEKACELPLDRKSQFPNLSRLEMGNFVRVLGEKEPGDLGQQFQALCIGTVIGVFILTYTSYQILTDGGKKLANPEWVYWLKIGAPSLAGVILAIGMFAIFLLRRKDGGREFLQSVTRWIAQGLSLLIILAIGMGLPAMACYFFGGGREVLGGQNSLAKLGRSIQLVFIFAASMLPALLYFLFDRHQLGTLRQKFEQQICRLDPNIRSLADVRAKYGRQIDEIYGRETATGEGRLTRGTRWPILVATVMITLGWVLTLLPAGSGSEITQPGQLIEFFLPQKTAVSFAFLGTYFFVLNMVLHRYVRADLKPKAYSSITVRIFVVVILAWVLGALFSGTTGLVVAFLVGVFPESGLTLIRESIRSQSGLGWFVRVLGTRTEEKYPLTKLEELDVYDRSRLLDEGVTNIESLAHHDLVDLMLETRIPVPRLVDWIDQAILYLHLGMETDDEVDNDNTLDGDKKDEQEKPKEDCSVAEVSCDLRSWLRGNYVRTATDFMIAFNEGKGSLGVKAEQAGRLADLKILLATLKDDEWLDYVHHWRNSRSVQDQSLNASSEPDKPSHVRVSLSNPDHQKGTYQADFLLHETRTDSLAPASELKKIGVEPTGEADCQLPDGTIQAYPFALVEMTFLGETTAGRVVFGPDGAEPILGVTTLESVGITIDPIDRTLRRRSGVRLTETQ
jgi:hypothetical protein